MGVYERSTSECSDSDIQIEPLGFEDLKRRRSDSSSDEDLADAAVGGSHRFFSAVMGMKRKKGTSMSSSPSLAKMAWKNAAIKALSLEDPWEKFHLDEYPTEKARRHRYNALRQVWVVDEVLVKMEPEPFNHGAMRECFRMKKLSNFSKTGDFSKAHNYVAKRYMDPKVPNNTYFDDVKLQMDAKLWGEEFNRHNPPKKVDIFQMAILEMLDREGQPMYHVEHFLEGKYVKYNSNSGYVKSEKLRMTPQVFSHFTFERSGHELIVVDIQGVGDLYTDPQIHTANGNDYGDGNLGTRGMALFFHSHICNEICKSLGLTQFDLGQSELIASRDIIKAQKFSKTVTRGTEEHVILPSEEERNNIQDCIRLRSISSGYISNDERDFIDDILSDNGVYSQGVDIAKDSFDDLNPSTGSDNEESFSSLKRKLRKPRIRYDSTTDFGDSTECKEKALQSFKDMVQRKSRPSHVLGELDHQKLLHMLTTQREEETVEHSILGQIHLDLAKYHELNRFVEENESYDRGAAFFHVEYAAKCNNLQAILTLAQIYTGLPHDILPDLELPTDQQDSDKAFQYLEMGAAAGDRSSIIRMAKAYDTGLGLPEGKTQDWFEAAKWYTKVLEECLDSDGNYDGTMDDPSYQINARLAHLYLTGGHGLDKDPNEAGERYTMAADSATEAMKGKLAAKYYMLAEEAWGEIEEE